MNLSAKKGIKGAQQLNSWEVRCDMFINFISVEPFKVAPYLRHGEKKQWLNSRRSMVS